MYLYHRIFAAFLAAVIGACILCGCDGGKNSTPDTQSVTQQSTGNGNINIPGYESLDFTAGKTTQSVRFHNPADNACIFRLTLSLVDETLWQSEDIAPGKKVDSISLERALDAGDYTAKLRYECFTLEDKAPLNGAEIEVALHVS